MTFIRIGVLALQGAFEEHERVLKRIGNVDYKIHVFQIRSSMDVGNADAIIIPGGESTSMRIICEEGEKRGDSILASLRRFALSGKPLWGTCAGCILLSDHVSSILGGGNNKVSPTIESVQAVSLYGDYHIGGVDINTCRNFFGRQVKSFETKCTSSVEEFSEFPCVFIRAPAIAAVGGKATALAKIHHNDQEIIVAARQGNLLVTCFHPELTEDTRIHKYFLAMVAESTDKSNSTGI